LDVAAFAKAGASLEGVTPLSDMPRLWESLVRPPSSTSASTSEGTAETGASASGQVDGQVDDHVDGQVSWQLHGQWKEAAARPAEIRLSLRVQARLWLTCQRCLQAVAHDISLNPVLRFVDGEEEAARLDEEAGDEEDVLALPRSLKVSELMEDELILALPLVPLHSVCPEPLPYLESSETQASTHITADGSAATADKPNPFAVLAQLKKKKGK
jgi:uncharacterized protein